MIQLTAPAGLPAAVNRVRVIGVTEEEVDEDGAVPTYYRVSARVQCGARSLASRPFRLIIGNGGTVHGLAIDSTAGTSIDAIAKIVPVLIPGNDAFARLDAALAAAGGGRAARNAAAEAQGVLDGWLPAGTVT